MTNLVLEEFHFLMQYYHQAKFFENEEKVKSFCFKINKFLQEHYDDIRNILSFIDKRNIENYIKDLIIYTLQLLNQNHDEEINGSYDQFLRPEMDNILNTTYCSRDSDENIMLDDLNTVVDLNCVNSMRTIQKITMQRQQVEERNIISSNKDVPSNNQILNSKQDIFLAQAMPTVLNQTSFQQINSEKITSSKTNSNFENCEMVQLTQTNFNQLNSSTSSVVSSDYLNEQQKLIEQKAHFKRNRRKWKNPLPQHKYPFSFLEQTDNEEEINLYEIYFNGTQKAVLPVSHLEHLAKVTSSTHSNLDYSNFKDRIRYMSEKIRFIVQNSQMVQTAEDLSQLDWQNRNMPENNFSYPQQSRQNWSNFSQRPRAGTPNSKTVHVIENYVNSTANIGFLQNISELNIENLTLADNVQNDFNLELPSNIIEEINNPLPVQIRNIGSNENENEPQRSPIIQQNNITMFHQTEQQSLGNHTMLIPGNSQQFPPISTQEFYKNKLRTPKLVTPVPYKNWLDCLDQINKPFYYETPQKKPKHKRKRKIEVDKETLIPNIPIVEVIRYGSISSDEIDKSPRKSRNDYYVGNPIKHFITVFKNFQTELLQTSPAKYFKLTKFDSRTFSTIQTSEIVKKFESGIALLKNYRELESNNKRKVISQNEIVEMFDASDCKKSSKKAIGLIKYFRNLSKQTNDSVSALVEVCNDFHNINVEVNPFQLIDTQGLIVNTNLKQDFDMLCISTIPSKKFYGK